MPAINDDRSTGVALGSSEGLIVLEDGSVVTTATNAPAVTASFRNTIIVNGQVGALQSAAILASDIAHITVGETGSVFTTGQFQTAAIDAQDLELHNFGLIRGNVAVRISALNDSLLENHGAMVGDIVFEQGFSALDILTLNNTGTISGDIVSNSGRLNLTNTGSISGTIFVQGGDVVIDSSRGVLNAQVVLGFGQDLVLGSAERNRIDGGGGSDTLDGGAGDDRLIGGFGADELIGGAGLDFASYESAFAGVTVNLAFSSENLGDAFGDTYAGIEGLIGSEYGDSLTGDRFANRLVGGGGTDTLAGGAGDDTYVADPNDFVFEAVGGGFDRILLYGPVSEFNLGAGQEIELVQAMAGPANVRGNELAQRLVGGAGNDGLLGDGGADRLQGGFGDDLLVGGAGRDRLEGGAGADIFYFDRKPAAGDQDLMVDFTPGQDDIALNAANFGFAPGSSGPLPAGAFALTTATLQPDDRILYDPSTGNLFYDADGSGSVVRVWFATVTAGLSLSASDFILLS